MHRREHAIARPAQNSRNRLTTLAASFAAVWMVSRYFAVFARSASVAGWQRQLAEPRIGTSALLKSWDAADHLPQRAQPLLLNDLILRGLEFASAVLQLRVDPEHSSAARLHP
jgi:hypothetical protein